MPVGTFKYRGYRRALRPFHRLEADLGEQVAELWLDSRDLLGRPASDRAAIFEYQCTLTPSHRRVALLESGNAVRRVMPVNFRGRTGKRPALGVSGAERVQFDALDRQPLDRVRHLDPKAADSGRRSVDASYSLHRRIESKRELDLRFGSK